MTQQPTLAHVPGILLRTILRTIARIILVLAGAVLLLGLGLAFLSLFLATFRSTRGPKSHALVNLMVAAVEAVRSYK